MTAVMLAFMAMFAIPPQGTTIRQTTSGPCSPAVANVTGNFTLTCIGVDPRAVAKLNAYLGHKNVELAEKIREANGWAERYHELEKQFVETKVDRRLSRQAEEYLHQGDLQKAGNILDKILKKEEKDVDRAAKNHYERALIFELQFQTLDALPHLEKAHQYRPNDYTYALEYARALHQENRFGAAENLYNQLLAGLRQLIKDNATPYQPNLAEILNNLALIYTDTQRQKEAEAP